MTKKGLRRRAEEELDASVYKAVKRARKSRKLLSGAAVSVAKCREIEEAVYDSVRALQHLLSRRHDATLTTTPSRQARLCATSSSIIARR